MDIERWGAFSVIDHQNEWKLAAEVLLYDRLLIPTPMDWDVERWRKKGWDPDGLNQKIELLGNEIVIKAAWDQDRQKDWASLYEALGEDQKDINNALDVTRRVLQLQERQYRPKGVAFVETFAAYQSPQEFKDFDPRSPTRYQDNVNNRLTGLIAHKIAVPSDPNPLDALNRAIDLAQSDSFRRNRRQFFDWQRDVLLRGAKPDDILAAIPSLVEAYNKEMTRRAPFITWETAVLGVALALEGIGIAAGLAPEAFSAIGIGPLTGSTVAQIGSFGTGAVIQVSQHFRAPGSIDSPSPGVLAGAMFHQINELRNTPSF